MHIYTTGQWVLLFFIYCFCGWVWESCYVSVCKRHWVNRGFLQGPILPIYGSGAILILFVTLPVKEHLGWVWLLGMIAATILEYVTGAVMERLFKVRYWDYSKHKVQLHGYICLSSSIAWGFFSILLVRYIHPPVGRVLNMVPDWVVDPLALVLAVIFTVDVVQSTQAALDFKEVLGRLTEENEELRHLAKRAELVAAFAEDDLKQFRNRTQLDKLLLQARIEEVHVQRKAKRTVRLERALQKAADIKIGILDEISGVLKERLTNPGEQDGLEELNELMEKVQEYKHKIKERETRKYRKFMRILHGNPSATAREYEDAMKKLRDIDKEK